MAGDASQDKLRIGRGLLKSNLQMRLQSLLVSQTYGFLSADEESHDLS